MHLLTGWGKPSPRYELNQIHLVSEPRPFDPSPTAASPRIWLSVLAPWPAPSLVVRNLADMDGWMVASPGYLAKHGRTTPPTELSGHSNMVYGHSRVTVTLPFDNGH